MTLLPPRPSPPLALFAAVSLGLHLAAAIGAHRAGAPPKAAFRSEAQALSGDTLDVEPPPSPTADEATAEQSTSRAASARSSPPVAGASRSLASPGRTASERGAATAAPSAAAFGAVGVRYATDLATTFTRAFPQAASADPVWSSAPFGSAGWAEVTLVLDEGGHVTENAIAGAPSPALRRGIERTIAILGRRAFTASGPATRLRVTARVGRDEVHDGLHGDVFALSGGSFSRDVGAAFFALPGSAGPGRRIDVELRILP